MLRSEGVGSPQAGFRSPWRRLVEYSTVELRARANEYRCMAASATTPQALGGLLRLAERFDALADQRERGADGAPQSHSPSGVCGDK